MVVFGAYCGVWCSASAQRYTIDSLSIWHLALPAPFLNCITALLPAAIMAALLTALSTAFAWLVDRVLQPLLMPLVEGTHFAAWFFIRFTCARRLAALAVNQV